MFAGYGGLIAFIASRLPPSTPSGAELTKVVEVAEQHIAITASDAIGLCEVIETTDRLVEFAGIEFAARGTELEFLQVAGDVVEVLAFMTIETRTRGGAIEIGHDAVDNRLLVATEALAISRVRVAVSVLRAGRQPNGEDCGAEKDKTQ